MISSSLSPVLCFDHGAAPGAGPSVPDRLVSLLPAQQPLLLIFFLDRPAWGSQSKEPPHPHPHLTPTTRTHARTNIGKPFVLPAAVLLGNSPLSVLA
jgi:hypothetical protein